MKIKLRPLVRGACIAALYAVLTVVLSPLSYGPVQVRFAEALTVLPYLMPEAIPALTVGCLIANLFGGSVLDMIFGTLATLAAACLTRKIRRLWLSPLPVIVLNGAIVGVVQVVASGMEFSAGACFAVAGSIALSEAAVCYVLGVPLTVLVYKLSQKVPFLK